MFIDVASGQFTSKRANAGVSEEVLWEAAQHVEQRVCWTGSQGTQVQTPAWLFMNMNLANQGPGLSILICKMEMITHVMPVSRRVCVWMEEFMNSTILGWVAALSLAVCIHVEYFENCIHPHLPSLQRLWGRTERCVWGRRVFPTCSFSGPLMG